MVFSDRCPRCGLIVEYTEEATLLTCLCKHTFQVAEFISQRQKLAQQLEAGEAAKQALVETQAEKTKLQERLNDTLTALELIQSSQTHEESALDSILEVLKEDHQTHDAMVGLLHAMRSEQDKGQDVLSQVLCAMMQEQSSAEDKLNEVQALVTRILDAQLSGAAAERKHLEKLKELYHQATALQVARVFDKAEEKYQTLLVEGGDDAKDAEVYWRLLLCHYGIEYQKDEEKLIPIILRPDLSPMESLDAYQNLKRYIKTDDQRKFYHAQLETINFYLQRYREVKQNPEWQYDVFISVKQSYGNQPTKDSVEAMKLFNRLVSKDPILASKKLKVFNSEITKPPITEPYEPYIMTALMSAKILIVVGSCQEFMNSQWVKNEWSRFQYLQELDLKKKNQTDRKLLCYLIGGMTPHDIPREMKELQAIVADADTGDKLRDIIEKTFPIDKSGTVEGINPSVSATSIETALERAFLDIEYGLFEKAEKRLDNVLEVSPKNAKAWLGKLMVDLKVRDRADLGKQEESFENNRCCSIVLRYGDPDIQKTIKEALAEIHANSCERKWRNWKNQERNIKDLLAAERWPDARAICEEVSTEYDDFAEVYLLTLLARYELPNEQALCTCIVPFEESDLWRKLRIYSHKEQWQKYYGYLAQAKKFRAMQCSAELLAENDIIPPNGRITSLHGWFGWILGLSCILFCLFSYDIYSVTLRFQVKQHSWFGWYCIVLCGVILFGSPISWLRELFKYKRIRKPDYFQIKTYQNNEIACYWENRMNEQYAISVDREWTCMTTQESALLSIPNDKKRHCISLSRVTLDRLESDKHHCVEYVESLYLKRNKVRRTYSIRRNIYSSFIAVLCLLSVAVYAAVLVAGVDSAIGLEVKYGTMDGTGMVTMEGDEDVSAIPYVNLKWNQVKFPDIPLLREPDTHMSYTIKRKLVNSDSWEYVISIPVLDYFTQIPIYVSGEYSYAVEVYFHQTEDSEPFLLGSEQQNVTIPERN